MPLINIINTPDKLISTSWLANKLFTNFGYKEDKFNEKDLLFKDSPMANQPLVADVSLIKYFKEISNQSFLSSCVANSVCDATEAVISHRKNLDPNNIDNLSRLFCYWNARNLQTPPSNSDNGTYIRLAADSVMRYGLPKETTWTYNENNVNIRPSIIAYREAIVNRISGFYRINSTGNERITQIKQALSAGSPVVFGTALEEKFKQIIDDSIIMPPTGSIIGNHAMVCCGIIENKNSFIVRNSWGTSFGFGGYCLMHYSYFTSAYTKDLWAFNI